MTVGDGDGGGRADGDGGLDDAGDVKGPVLVLGGGAGCLLELVSLVLGERALDEGLRHRPGPAR